MGIREERITRAAEMPHRQNLGDALDARLENTIGRFYLKGFITGAECDAGMRYGEIVIAYLQTIDAPYPYGAVRPAASGIVNELSDDVCFQRKIACAQVRQILKDAAEACRIRSTEVIAAVDNLAVYGEAPQSEKQMKALRIGLRALAHGSNVIPFRRKSGGKNEGESRRAGVDPVP